MAKRTLRVSALAEADIQDVLEWSDDQFGQLARNRYATLIASAVGQLAALEAPPGSIARPELGAGVFTYHLHFSRKKVASARLRVQKPRHMLIYRMGSDGAIEAARLLHDSIELKRHLPDVPG